MRRVRVKVLSTKSLVHCELRADLILVIGFIRKLLSVIVWNYEELKVYFISHHLLFDKMQFFRSIDENLFKIDLSLLKYLYATYSRISPR